MTTNTHIAAQARNLASKAARLGARQFGDELIQCLRECAQALEAVPALDAQGEARNATRLELLRDLISNDAYALSFQTMGQYRTAILKAFDSAPLPHAVGKPLSEQQIAVLRFLDGVGDLRGHGFGMKPPEERGNYWWRKDLRAAFPSVDFGIVST